MATNKTSLYQCGGKKGNTTTKQHTKHIHIPYVFLLQEWMWWQLGLDTLSPPWQAGTWQVILWVLQKTLYVRSQWSLIGHVCSIGPYALGLRSPCVIYIICNLQYLWEREHVCGSRGGIYWFYQETIFIEESQIHIRADLSRCWTPLRCMSSVPFRPVLCCTHVPSENPSVVCPILHKHRIHTIWKDTEVICYLHSSFCCIAISLHHLLLGISYWDVERAPHHLSQPPCPPLPGTEGRHSNHTLHYWENAQLYNDSTKSNLLWWGKPTLRFPQ